MAAERAPAIGSGGSSSFRDHDLVPSAREVDAEHPVGGSHVVHAHSHADGVDASREDQNARGSGGREEAQLVWRRGERETEVEPAWSISLDVARLEIGLTRPFEKHGRKESRRGRRRAIGIPHADSEQPATAIPRRRATVISNHDVAEVSRRSSRNLTDLIGRGRVEVHVEPRAPQIAPQPGHRGDCLADHVNRPAAGGRRSLPRRRRDRPRCAVPRTGGRGRRAGSPDGPR